MNDHRLINIGILGLASIASRSVLPAINNLDNKFCFFGFASENNKSVYTDRGKSTTINYKSYEALLDDNEIDAVYIPLPNALHHKYVIKALNRGKHVIVEKPAGCSELEVKEMVSLAKSRDLVLLENFQFRFHSQLQLILQHLDRGSIGELRSVRVSFGFPPFVNQSNIRYDSELGGGSFLDCGVYALMIAPFFLGNNIEVVHAATTFDESKGVDIWGGGTIKQVEGNLICQFAFGFDNFYQCGLELWGSKGKISASRIFTAPPNVSPRVFLETDVGREIIPLNSDNQFENMLVHFYCLVHGQSQRLSEYQNMIRQAVLMEKFLNLTKGNRIKSQS